MSYENAPSTKMLATRCAICARPLRDANSVECGVGPDCRAKHGFDVVTGEPDWAAAGQALLPTLLARPQTDAFQARWEARDARGAVNALIHAVAVAQQGPAVGPYVAAIRALGYAKIGDAIAKRLGAVWVTPEGEQLVIRSPWSEDFTAALRAARLPSRWDAERKVRLVPASKREALWKALQAGFPAGTLIIGAKGTRVL